MLAAGETKMSFNESGVLEGCGGKQDHAQILPPVFIQSEVVTAL